MHRICTHILRSPLLTTLLVGALAILTFLLVPQFAHADDLDALLNPAQKAESTVMWLFYNMVVGLTGFLATMALDALTYSVREFVIGFGGLYQTGGLGVALEQVWTIIRDLFNFALIFGLIYIGFKMIIDANDSRAKRTLASLIVAALLVNFSLFIAKAIIEVTNLVATYITADLLKIDLVSDPATLTRPPSLGAPFMEAIGFSSLVNIELLHEISLIGFVYIFMLGIILMVLAIVAFAGAFLMTVRFISLCIYIVFSPLMFLGWVFPSMAGQSDKFMKGLLGKAFTAPAYLFMLYLSIEVIIQVSNTIREDRALNILTGGGARGVTSADIGPLIVTYLVAMGFMIGSVIIAQKMGATGADASMRVINNIGNRSKRFAQNAAVNTGLYAPRRVARGATGAASRGLRNLDNRLLGSTSTRGRVARTALGAVGLDARTRDNALRAGENARFGLRYSSQDNIDNNRRQTNRMNEQQNRRERETARQQNLDVLNDQASAATDVNTAMEQLARTIRDLTNDELTHMSLDQLTDHNVALNLSDTQIDTLRSSGRFTNDQVNTIRNARNQAQINVARVGTATVTAGGASTNNEIRAGGAPAMAEANLIRERLVSRGTQAAGNLRPQVFMQPAMYEHITPSMLEQRMRNGITGAELANMRIALNAHLGIAPGTLPSATLPANNQWVRWETGNSNYASRFFT